MLLRSLALLLWIAPLLPAEVAGLRIVERSPVLNGAAFGETGAYERVIAKAHFAVDPHDPANAGIADIGAAPRNAQGLVEFSADVCILKPTRPQRGSGTILFEVSNRGGKGLMRFNRAENPGARDPRSAADFGDGFLFKRGYTLVWVGWQFDLLEREHALRLEAPGAEGVEGRTRSHFSPSAPAASFSVAGRGHKPYAAADPADPGAKLIVRGYPDGPGREIPRKRWRFLDPQTVALDGGFAAGKTYDVVYRAKNPGVAGLGAAAIRDFVSWLKFGGEGKQGELGELCASLDRAIAFGSSQSGRLLRTFLYEGFNADERGRRVFDGVWPHIAGAARGSFTHRFAQPTRQDPYYTVEIFPFRDLPDKDPLTGESGGVLVRAEQDGVAPKIVHTLTSSEYWNRSASLLHTTLDGKADAPLAESTRVYYFAGTQHGSGSTPPRRSAELAYPRNANAYAPLLRAILVGLEEWVTHDREPPASKYPRVGELTDLAGLRFPKTPGPGPPKHQRRALRLDFGPEFRSKGIIAFQPPRTAGPPYPAKLPRLDRDGNELGGVRLPAVAAPLASFTGWNRFKESVSAADHNPGNAGAAIPFAWTKAERLKRADPRLSVEERYAGRGAYRKKAAAAARALVAGGYLLAQDAPHTVEHALALWDYLESVAANGRNEP